MRYKNIIISTYLLLLRLKHKGKVDLIQDILKWSKGTKVLHDQRCFILNYGYSASFPFPYLRMTSDSDFHLNVGTLGINSPSKCSIVVIGGKYLEQVDEVMRMVDKITEDIAWINLVPVHLARRRCSRSCC